jgi:hypothetical protein
VKYSTLLVALSYVTGFIANAEFATVVGVDLRGEISLAQPRTFAYGAAIIPVFSLGALLIGLVLSLRVFELAQRRVPSVLTYETVLIGIPLITSTTMTLLIRSHGADLYQTMVIWSSTFLGNVIVGWLLTTPLQSGPQVTVRIVAAIALLFVFSGAVADAEAGQAKNDPRRNIQLLVAGDIVGGAKELGIPFVQGSSQTSSALTQPVRLVYSGDRTYALRLRNNRLVQVSKDKVWGFTGQE